jgi:DNA polymerase (family 10)
MKNHEVAILLRTIAELLDIKGDNFFKIRAYRMAAQIIDDLSEDIEVLVNENRLKDLEGVGPALSKKITEYITAGTVSYLEQLEKQIPPSLLSLLDIQSLGPKKVATLYKKLHITSIKELKEACKKGKLRDLDGFGVLTEHNILRGIALKEKTKGRILLHHATQVGENIVSFLKKSDHVNRIDVAGSLRRKKETIGDIDILVASDNADEVMDWAVKYPDVNRVLMKGTKKTSILISNNVQVDIRVVEKKNYGAALQYFTGSKEHNVAIRALALKQGYKLNEYGLFSKNGSYITGKEEKTLYETLHLSYIPPELRENRGEITESLNNNLPTLLNLDDIKGDLHVHSTYSDGHETIENMVKKAKSLRYIYLGISDHSKSLHIANGLNHEQVIKKKEEIQLINKTTDFKVFLGTECDILSNGLLDYEDETLALFDFVGIGIHSKFKMTEKEATERITQAMQHPKVLFLAHPTCRLFGQREMLPINMETLFEVAIETNTALEINSFPDRLDLNDIHVKRGKELGVKFCINTDAHNLEHMDFIRYGISVAQRGWLEKSDVINTFDTKKLKQLFKR